MKVYLVGITDDGDLKEVIECFSEDQKEEAYRTRDLFREVEPAYKTDINVVEFELNSMVGASIVTYFSSTSVINARFGHETLVVYCRKHRRVSAQPLVDSQFLRLQHKNTGYARYEALTESEAINGLISMLNTDKKVVLCDPKTREVIRVLQEARVA